MHYKEAKTLLSNYNGMNIYRGCTHGCIYCDSRSKCYQINHEFTDIEVKINAPLLLEDALRRKKAKCMIGTGSMTDPYIPLENKLELTKKCLEIIYKYGFGINIMTKSTLLLRDLDLLKKINERSKTVVNVTITTADEKLCKIIEPNVATTKERIEMLKVLSNNNIKTIVWLCPILPFINDNEENIRKIVKECADAKVYGILCFGMGLTLREGNREYFYSKLDEHFKGLKEKYIKYYGERYEINSFNNNRLMEVLKEECLKNNIILNNEYLFNYMHEFKDDKEQLELF